MRFETFLHQFLLVIGTYLQKKDFATEFYEINILFTYEMKYCFIKVFLEKDKFDKRISASTYSIKSSKYDYVELISIMKLSGFVSIESEIH
jgi:hypothetical protein